MKTKILSACLLGMAALNANAASFLNGGFESGDLSGWAQGGGYWTDPYNYPNAGDPSLYAVGGCVRDAFMSDASSLDVDYTTNARPDDILRLLRPLCTATWDMGRAFGTIGGQLAATKVGAQNKAQLAAFIDAHL